MKRLRLDERNQLERGGFREGWEAVEREGSNSPDGSGASGL